MSYYKYFAPIPGMVKPQPQTKKVWTAIEIKAKLQTNNAWLEKAIVAIWKNQTQFEAKTKQTVESNGIGFNGADAFFLSAMADLINAGKKLTSKQLEASRKKMLKYSRQLAGIANSKK